MCYYVLLELLHTCSVGTEGRNRTDTVSPPPDFESGASTSSATQAHAVIITELLVLTIGSSDLYK